MRLIEIALFTPDVRGTVEFYRKLLDMQPVWESDGAAQFDLGGVDLLIHVKEEGGPSPGFPPDEDHIAFGVDNVDEACEELRLKGLKVKIGPRDFDWGRSAYLEDHDLRLVEIHQTRQRGM